MHSSVVSNYKNRDRVMIMELWSLTDMINKMTSILLVILRLLRNNLAILCHPEFQCKIEVLFLELKLSKSNTEMKINRCLSFITSHKA